MVTSFFIQMPSEACLPCSMPRAKRPVTGGLTRNLLYPWQATDAGKAFAGCPVSQNTKLRFIGQYVASAFLKCFFADFAENANAMPLDERTRSLAPPKLTAQALRRYAAAPRHCWLNLCSASLSKSPESIHAAARTIAARIAFALELPWQTMLSPLRPSSGAPPTSS